MDILKKHEMFEIEVLERMKSAKLLDPLVFGGGTMLRLCHELNRYSVDLDFWFVKKRSEKEYFRRLKEVIGNAYEITDAEIKHYTILVEARSRDYPKRLKIEIRKEVKDCDFEERIAYSRYATKQVILRTHTLEQTMRNKIEAFSEREEIRDPFDIEFLLRKGVPLPEMSKSKADELMKVLRSFKENDFKVKLGSVLEKEAREYYVKNRFTYLLEKLQQLAAGC